MKSELADATWAADAERPFSLVAACARSLSVILDFLRIIVCFSGHLL